MPRKTSILRAPKLLKPLIVRELFLRGGRATIEKGQEPGPDRIIYDNVADKLGVTTKERKELIDEAHPRHAGGNKWNYTMLVAVQQLRQRGAYMRMSTQRGVWELTSKGMDYGRKMLGASLDR